MIQIKTPNNKESIILIIFFIILLNNFNFLKNFYFLVNKDFSTRLNKVYKFCGHESVGFLFYIKKKYEIKQSIPIKNYKISPNPSWIFYNSAKSKLDESKLILLNYKNESKMKFEKIDNNSFKTNFLPSDIDGIDRLTFITKKKLKDQKFQISIIHEVFEDRNVIFKKKIIINENNEIFLNFISKDLNIRTGNLYVELESLNNVSVNNMEIQTIISHNITKFDLKKFNILEKISNCYLLEKNV